MIYCRLLYTVHCTLYTVHCTLHCTLYTVHCTVYSSHCTHNELHCDVQWHTALLITAQNSKALERTAQHSAAQHSTAQRSPVPSIMVDPGGSNLLLPVPQLSLHPAAGAVQQHQPGVEGH